MLRQQLHPDERVHGAILQAPGITNAIPETTQTKYTVRSRTINRVKALGARVEKCLEAGALASGCELEIQSSQIFADLVVNKPLCKGFQECMADQGEQLLDLDKVLMSGSTDQGNVSQIMPALHALVGIPVRDGAKNHTRQFTTAAGTQEAHRQTITAGKALAMTGWMVLVDDEFYQNVKDDFVVSKGTAL
jgi:metal-dependent amidase/aminoacylase/carboxypeptidase family protein